MAEQLRILALDHFSSQDREALIAASGDTFAWRTVPYWRFRNRANEIFPPDVQEGVEAWARSDLEAQRRAYAAWCRRELGRMYIEWPFDVLLLPSDAFYYVRAFPDVCHELGVPVFVAQKETTITDYSMVAHAPQIRAFAPFVSDRMSVCSERHKRFWVEAGTPESLVDVTGQPRFDVYAEGIRPPVESQRTVLFLSYEPDAYLLEPADREKGWLDLRDETEDALIAATTHGWTLLVKLHPLQDREVEQAALSAKAAGNAQVVLASPDADTRELILDADAVVGFQTTALYEAMAAGKPVAYTAWGALYDRFRSILIPFEERNDLLDVVRSAEELADWLRDPPPVDPAVHHQRLAFVEEMLGPIDGRASERTLASIRNEAGKWSRNASASTRRRTLNRVRLLARPALVITEGARTAALRAAAMAPGRLGGAANFRLGHHQERLSALRGGR